MVLQKDYILIVIRQIGRLIAKLLKLKSAGDDQGMKQTIYEVLQTAGIDGSNPLAALEVIDGIKDERLLVSLHEALSIYLAVTMDVKLSLIDDRIVDTLKAKKKLVLDI